MVDHPCPPPVDLALRSQPVLQASCAFAEEHRALQERRQTKSTLNYQRLHCLTAIRGQLGDDPAKVASLSTLLVAVLLLYFLEGYIDYTNSDTSTRCHFLGVLAILDTLGDFEAAWVSSDQMTRVLLSEFASTDLTDALLQDRRPCFPTKIWDIMESGSVSWEMSRGTKSLATVFSTMSEMSSYLHAIRNGADASNECIQEFERALQPSYSMLNSSVTASTSARQELLEPATASSFSLLHAFQHAGLIYLYSAILDIPTQNFPVQQHVHAFVECIHGIDVNSRVQNCALYPLYVAGAHAIIETHRIYILERFDIIYSNLGFQSVQAIQSALQHLWAPPEGSKNWTGTFKGAQYLH